MYYILSEEKFGRTSVKEFVCDTSKDLNEINDCSLGDIAVVVAPAAVYLRNSKEQWLEL